MDWIAPDIAVRSFAVGMYGEVSGYTIESGSVLRT